jgi:sugar phosphate isomerase/epimerase
MIAQAHTTGYPVASRDVDEHLESLRRQLVEAKEIGAIMVNSHSGSDSWSLKDSVRFFKEASKMETEIGIKLIHETHRQRILFNPWITRDILAEVPDLKLNADLSHFAVVAERVFDDGTMDKEWPGILQSIAKNCHLIHARVGYAEGTLPRRT